MSVKITRITETRRGRFALFEDEEFLFSVDEETLVTHGIREGTILTDSALFQLREDSDLRRAKDAALRFLSLRAYAEQELYQKLLPRFDGPTAAAAVAEMAGLGLLDDEAFAMEKARGMAERGKSSAEIRRKLASLGIDAVTVEAVVCDAAMDDTANALRLVEKSYLEKLQRGEKEKVMAALARRGFSHSVIRGVVQTTQEELERTEDCLPE